MPLRTFMLAMAWFHFLAGAFFLFFTQAAVDFIFRAPVPEHSMLVVGLGAVVTVFGLMNYLARNSKDARALRAVLVGTACYLAFTVFFDAYWTVQGAIEPIAWISIALRAFLAGMYVRYVARG